mmetsp:Transcript_13189/g.27997  ORF Transcript_13189/g.27997 Transcript_13189/m.27997 type:complete len:223 (-) Transcript_13189:233-901(-)
MPPPPASDGSPPRPFPWDGGWDKGSMQTLRVVRSSPLATFHRDSLLLLLIRLPHHPPRSQTSSRTTLDRPKPPTNTAHAPASPPATNPARSTWAKATDSPRGCSPRRAPAVGTPRDRIPASSADGAGAAVLPPDRTCSLAFVTVRRDVLGSRAGGGRPTFGRGPCGCEMLLLLLWMLWIPCHRPVQLSRMHRKEDRRKAGRRWRGSIFRNRSFPNRDGGSGR